MVVLHSRKEDDARGFFNNFIICCQFLSRALPKVLSCGYDFSKSIGKCNSMLYAKHMWCIIPKLLWCGYAFSKARGKCNSMLYAKHMWSIILDGLVLQEDKFINEV